MEIVLNGVPKAWESLKQGLLAFIFLRTFCTFYYGEKSQKIERKTINMSKIIKIILRGVYCALIELLTSPLFLPVLIFGTITYHQVDDISYWEGFKETLAVYIEQLKKDLRWVITGKRH